MRGFDCAFRVGHHAEHIAGGVNDAGDVARGAVDAFGIAEGDAAFAFQPVERLGVGDVRAGKLIELEVADSIGQAEIEEMCRKLLANTVIENFRIEAAEPARA